MKKYFVLFSPALGSISACIVAQNTALAQIVPDATLPVNSNVIQQGNTNIIEAGTKAGSNLFHSFGEFSVPTGTEAFFNNSFDIQNIFTRVTGGSISNIDGLIRANGVANLFLINPNGIIFGPNARLNIGGSFLTSTASSIKFADDLEFSAINANASNLLSINLPIGLQLGKNAGEIRVQGKGQPFDSNGATESFDRSLNPLEVLPGNTLSIVGGNVIIDGGILQASGGHVELGGLAAEGTVGINPDRSLSFPEGVARSNVSIVNKAGINVLSSGGGSITITSKNLDISGSSILSAGIAKGKDTPKAIAGDISLNATEGITVTSSTINNNVNANAIGSSGEIKIVATSLKVLEGSLINTINSGKGNARNITIIASDTISLDGERKDGTNSKLESKVVSNGEGNAGNIDITTKSLNITRGAGLSSSTSGKGNAGSVTIRASDTVSLDGENSRGKPTGILTVVKDSAIGNGGDVNISTKILRITAGGLIDATTSTKGNAGNVTIAASDTIFLDGSRLDGSFSGITSTVQTKAEGNGGSINISTNSLIATNGGTLNSNTFNLGNAGSITIIASDRVSFDGETNKGLPGGILSTASKSAIGNAGIINITAKSLSVTGGSILTTATGDPPNLNNGTEVKGNAGSINIVASESVTFSGQGNQTVSGAITSVENNAVGNGGGININTGTLSITDGALAISESRGKGAAGNIVVKADTLILDNLAEINTETTNGDNAFKDDQASIKLDTSTLILRDRSRITTNAVGENIFGGNITINSDVLAALGNSDISANSTNSKGGIVTINAASIFGAQSRTREELESFLSADNLDPILLFTSDITATGADSSLSGTVTINTPDVDPDSGLIALPDNLSDITDRIATACAADRGNFFVIIGRGGLPPDPTQTLASSSIWRDLRPLGNVNVASFSNSVIRNDRSSKAIVEAQGLAIDPQGKIALVAEATTLISNNLNLRSAQCQP